MELPYRRVKCLHKTLSAKIKKSDGFHKIPLANLIYLFILTTFNVGTTDSFR